MSLPDSLLNILLINEHPDEIKLVTSSLRGFFTGCRIEAGYSSEEALAFSQRGEWHIIVIDQDLNPESGLDVLARIRRHAPYAAIILQTTQSDSHTAVQALQSGADFLLFKHSPGFITELLCYVQEAVEKRDLQMKLDHTFQRHLRLVETLSDLPYELDQDGRFVYVSTTVTAMLGYSPDELAGRHYSILLPPLQEAAGRFRLNERRTGSRSVRKLELTLQRKALPNISTTTITVEVTAKGLYDSANRFIGTIGVLRDLSQQKQQQDRLEQLESRLRETDRQFAFSREAALVSRRLQRPLSTLLQNSQRLLSTLRHSRIEQHVEHMIAQASQASRLNQQLTQAIHARESGMELLALNEILPTVVQSIRREQPGMDLLQMGRLAEDLPMILGRRDAIVELARILLSYARRSMSGTATTSRLVLHTEPLTMEDLSPSHGDRLFAPSAPLVYATFTIREVTEDAVPILETGSDERISPEEFLRAHQIVQAQGGAIEIEHAVDRGLTIRVRIPSSADVPAVPLTQKHHEPSTSTAPFSESGPLSAPGPSVAAPTDDRRLTERRLFSLPVQLSLGTTTLRAILRNMSTGGALLTIQDQSPVIHLQPAYVTIKTPVSFLELQGVVHERSTSAPDTTVALIKDIVITFSLTPEHDRNVLHSLLDGIRDGSTTVTFEALILPPVARPESSRADVIPANQLPEDRRETIRLSVALPVRLAVLEDRVPRPLGLISNLSRDGACIEMSGHPRFLAVRQMIQLMPVGPITPSAGVSHVEESDQPWTGRVIWMRPHRISTTPRSMTTDDRRLYVGVRFEQPSSAQEQHLLAIIASEIPRARDLAEPVSDASVVTIPYSLRNREGHRIALCHDSARQAQFADIPLVLLCPGYGVTQQAYVAFAYFLAGSGLRILRYDHSRHIGLSDGDPSQTTLTSLEDDLDTVLAFIQKEWQGTSLTLLAPDLLGRIALRRRDWHRLIRRLLLLNPTLNLRHYLTTLHQRDVIQEHLAGSRFGTGNLMGIPLDIDHFLADAVAGHYTDANMLHEDLEHCRTDIVLLTTGADTTESPTPGPSQALVNDALTFLGTRGSHVNLPSVLLNTGDVAPQTQHASWQRVRRLCQQPDTSPFPSSAALPTFSRSTAIRARFEREQLRAKHAAGGPDREQLWTLHTDLTPSLDELPAYWQYIDHLYQISQPLDEGLALLDIGCGIHSFARLLLLNLSYRLRAQTWHHTRPIRYIGLDFSPSMLRAAQAVAKDALRHVETLFSGRISTRAPVTLNWALGRSMEALPFADGSFDRIVANLSLSFTASPLHALREVFRVLRPGGKLIVSTFTPAADMAILYRPPLQESGIDEFTGEARVTLNRMAQICKALRVGHLNAFEEDTLTARLTPITGTPAKLVRALSGHILIAIAEKPDSSG